MYSLQVQRYTSIVKNSMMWSYLSHVYDGLLSLSVLSDSKLHL